MNNLRKSLLYLQSSYLPKADLNVEVGEDFKFAILYSARKIYAGMYKHFACSNKVILRDSVTLSFKVQTF